MAKHRSLVGLFFLGFAGAAVALSSGCRDGTDTTSTSTSSTGSGTSSSSTGSGVGGQGTALKILDWNCHNFYDDKKNGTMTGEIVKSTTDYQKQLGLIAGVISALDPDVVVLEEVENQGVLDALNGKLGNKYTERSLIEGNDTRGINNAAMAKFAFTDVVSHKDDMFTVIGSPAPVYHYTRDAVEYHFTFGGRKIALIGVHYRSKIDPDDPNKRLAEAEHSREIADGITAADPSTGIVILGDYNDTPSSDPLTATAGKASDLYTDAANNVPSADQYSFIFMGTKELIDHQMANALMTGFVEDATIVHNQDVDDASDHSPMMITYSLK